MKCRYLSIIQPTAIHKFPSINHLAKLHHHQNSLKKPKQHQLSCSHHDINHIKQHHAFFIYSNLKIDKKTTHFVTRKKVTINCLLSCFIHIMVLLIFFIRSSSKQKIFQNFSLSHICSSSLIDLVVSSQLTSITLQGDTIVDLSLDIPIVDYLCP